MGLRRVLRLWGVDRAIVYTLFWRGWPLISGPITLIFLARFLSLDEQGFYYTFSNVIGLQVIFELGLSGVILQFAAHDKAKLEWTERGTLHGDAATKTRLSMLLRKALVWYGIVSILFTLIVMPVGYIFFSSYKQHHAVVHWQVPWFWLVLMEVCSLFTSPIFAVLEGCGLVAQIALLRFGQTVIQSLLLWTVLAAHGRLIAAPFAGSVALFYCLVWLLCSKRAFLADMAAVRTAPDALDWKREIWPFQWRIAVTWLTGYFITNLFTPVLFHYHSAASAARMGMSLNIAMAIWAAAFAWINTKAAPFGMLISNREFQKLDKQFFPCLWQALSVSCFGSIVVWLGACYIHAMHYRWSERLLEPLPLALLLASINAFLVVTAQALYLRAHKQEPFVSISVLSGCLNGISAYVMGRWFGATGMMAGYCVINLFILVMATRIFQQKRLLWHGEAAYSEAA